MDIEHKILQVGIHTGLIVNRGLFIRQQMIELNYTYGDGLMFLRFHHLMLKHWVFDNLESDYGSKLTSLSHVPPVITVQRSVQVISQTL